MSESMRLNCQMIEFWCLNCQSAGRCGQQLGEGKVVLVLFQFILYDFSCMAVLADMRRFIVKCIEVLKTHFVVEKPVRVTTPKVLS